MRLAIPSVNYGDLLAVTLPAWARLGYRDQVFVLTSDGDTETQAVARSCRVKVVTTDAWTRRDVNCHVNGRMGRRMRGWKKSADDTPTFNLALALDEAFGLIGATSSLGVIGVVDADCYPFGRLPADADIIGDTIYGCWRYRCETTNVLSAHRSAKTKRSDLRAMRASGRIEQSQHRDVPNVGEGYCQIFRHQPGLRFGSYPGADEYDFDLALKFSKGVLLEDFYVLHLGENGRNWDGRVTPRWEAVPA